MSEDSSPQREPELHEYLDMEAYDVVSGERHRAALALLRRVEPELVPNHDAAEELREKLLGGPPLPNSAFIAEIREFLNG